MEGNRRKPAYEQKQGDSSAQQGHPHGVSLRSLRSSGVTRQCNDLDPVRSLADIEMRQFPQRSGVRVDLIGAQAIGLFPECEEVFSFRVDIEAAWLHLRRIVLDQSKIAAVDSKGGLTTSAIPYRQMAFEVEFALLAHYLSVRTSAGSAHRFPLFARSVADFYGQYMACIHSLGIEVSIDCTPDEF